MKKERKSVIKFVKQPQLGITIATIIIASSQHSGLSVRLLVWGALISCVCYTHCSRD